jgi:hypothetical protein
VPQDRSQPDRVTLETETRGHLWLSRRFSEAQAQALTLRIEALCHYPATSATIHAIYEPGDISVVGYAQKTALSPRLALVCRVLAAEVKSLALARALLRYLGSLNYLNPEECLTPRLRLLAGTKIEEADLLDPSALEDLDTALTSCTLGTPQTDSLIRVLKSFNQLTDTLYTLISGQDKDTIVNLEQLLAALDDPPPNSASPPAPARAPREMAPLLWLNAQLIVASAQVDLWLEELYNRYGLRAQEISYQFYPHSFESRGGEFAVVAPRAFRDLYRLALLDTRFLGLCYFAERICGPHQPQHVRPTSDPLTRQHALGEMPALGRVESLLALDEDALFGASALEDWYDFFSCLRPRVDSPERPKLLADLTRLRTANKGRNHKATSMIYAQS